MVLTVPAGPLGLVIGPALFLVGGDVTAGADDDVIVALNTSPAFPTPTSLQTALLLLTTAVSVILSTSGLTILAGNNATMKSFVC